MANTTITYNNPNRANANKVDNSNRFKINQQVLNMIARNPSLGMGYLIGSALGENYWGRKRNKSSQNAHDYAMNGSVGADSNGVYGADNSNGAVKYQGRPDVDWSAYNKALDSVPRTPAQANKPAVTLENAGAGGGVPSVADAWNNMANGSAYNYGGTPLYTGGVRNLGNVIGADENGLVGVSPVNSAPSVANFPQKPGNMPTPYTDDQLRQIAAQNFTPDELSRMATQSELARMNALTQPAQGQAQPSGGGGLLASAVANSASAPTTPASQTAFVPEEEAVAMDRKMRFVPEEEAGLAEAYRVANDFSRAAATPAGALNYSNRFITPGHDPSLEWHPFATQPTQSDLAAREMALKWLKETANRG